MQETQEMWVRPLGWEDPLEEEIATHSRMLTWEIPWTEEPSRLQSIGLQGVRHNWAHTHTHTHTQSLAYYHLWWLASSADTSYPTEVVGPSQCSEGPATFLLFSVLSQISLVLRGICLRSSLLNISWVNILPSACFALGATNVLDTGDLEINETQDWCYKSLHTA